jgi:hypothetical protein
MSQAALLGAFGRLGPTGHRDHHRLPNRSLPQVLWNPSSPVAQCCAGHRTTRLHRTRQAGAERISSNHSTSYCLFTASRRPPPGRANAGAPWANSHLRGCPVLRVHFSSLAKVGQFSTGVDITACMRRLLVILNAMLAAKSLGKHLHSLPPLLPFLSH